VAGRGRIVLVSGEAGIGKTALVEGFWNATVQEDGLEIHRRGWCTFHLDFNNGQELASGLSYVNIDESKPFPGQLRRETTQGPVPEIQPMTPVSGGTLHYQSAANGGFYISYKNPVYMAHQTVQTFTNIGNGYQSSGVPMQGQDNFNVYCSPDHFSASGLSGKLDGAVSSEQMKLQKYVPTATIHLVWKILPAKQPSTSGNRGPISNLPTGPNCAALEREYNNQIFAAGQIPFTDQKNRTIQQLESTLGAQVEKCRRAANGLPPLSAEPQ
jgi:hypothetical protein